MAQSVTIAGITFPDVPSLQIPKSGGGSAVFVDPSPTTAAASDVASGKTFFDASGALTTGTASGGGGGPIIPGALRPDAELWQSWTYDKLAVADLGFTIPAYTTSRTNIVNVGTLATLTPDHSQYCYLLTYAACAWPIYSTNTLQNGMYLYQIAAGAWEGIHYPAGTFVAPNGTYNTSDFTQNQYSLTSRRDVYYTSSNVQSSTSGYGTSTTTPTESVSSTSITVRGPYFYLQGSATALNSDAWALMTDVRMQCVFKLYRIPRTSAVIGFTMMSLIDQAIGVGNSKGTLT
jgi:hypothetical protein